MTKLEKSILLHRLWAMIIVLFFLVWVIMSFHRHWFIGIFSVIASLFGIRLFSKVFNLYIPQCDYFKVMRRCSRDEKKELSRQCMLFGEAPRIGEIAFTKDWIVFVKLGAVLAYDKVVQLYYKKATGGLYGQATVYRVFVVTNKGKKYTTNIFSDGAPFRGEYSAFDRAVTLFKSKKQ